MSTNASDWNYKINNMRIFGKANNNNRNMDRFGGVYNKNNENMGEFGEANMVCYFWKYK